MKRWRFLGDTSQKVDKSNKNTIEQYALLILAILRFSVSLHSKRLQSSYGAKVGASVKEIKDQIPLFASRPNFLNKFARKRLLRRLVKFLSENSVLWDSHERHFLVHSVIKTLAAAPGIKFD